MNLLANSAHDGLSTLFNPLFFEKMNLINLLFT